MPLRAVHFTFVLRTLDRDWPDLHRLDEGAIAAQPARFVGGRNSWIAQGYLRLRKALESRGHRVRLSDRPVPGTICFAHRDDVDRFRTRAHASFLVVVRADRAPVFACDFAITQNGLSPREHERFVPLWPQPGLCHRDADRPSRVRRIVYHGRTGTMPSWFRELLHSGELASRGVRFDIRRAGWEDYRDADLVLAAREDADVMLACKPASKVYNGWLAGVPVLAAPEPAYREQRRTRLDYLEVQDAGDVVEAVDRLNACPALYDAMVANGANRARAFGVEATRRRWLRLIDDEIVPAFREEARRLADRRLWFLGAMLKQKLLSRAWKCRLATGRWMLRSPWAPTRLLESFGSQIVSAYAAVPPSAGEGPTSAFR